MTALHRQYNIFGNVKFGETAESGVIVKPPTSVGPRPNTSSFVGRRSWGMIAPFIALLIVAFFCLA